MQAPFPLFGALNVPYRIIELLHTNRHRELLSERPWVRIPPGTPANTPKTFDLSGFSAFLVSGGLSDQAVKSSDTDFSVSGFNALTQSKFPANKC